MDINIIGWGDYFPSCEYTNEDLCRIFKLPLEKAQKYENLLGIKKRAMCIDHWNEGKQIIRDDQMAAEAAKKAMKIANISSDEIDAIISVCSTFDYIMPGIAERVQGNLKTIECHVFNLMGGCAEFINGLILAKLLLEQGRAKTVLLTASEVGNAFYKDFRYPLQWFMGGDGSGAFILSTKYKGPFIVSESYFKSVGRLENLFSVPLWGIKEPCPLLIENEDIDPSLTKLVNIDIKYRWYRSRIKGSVDYTLTFRAIERAANKVLGNKDESKLRTYFIFPQNELQLVENLATTLGLKMDQVSVDLIEHGYMGTASPPVCFCESFDKLSKYKYVILVEAGAGAAFGAILLEKT